MASAAHPLAGGWAEPAGWLIGLCGLLGLVVGVALNICVRSTVHDAFFLGYDVCVVPEACQATGQREEDSTLYDIETHFGEVRTIEQLGRDWSAAPIGG